MATYNNLPALPANPIRSLLLERHVAREITQQQGHNAIAAVRDEAAAADHWRHSILVLGTAVKDAQLATQAADEVRDLVGGDSLKAAVATPFLDEAVRLVRADFQQTFASYR